MKYLILFALALGTLSSVQAQTFQWNTKSPQLAENEVNPNDPARVAYEQAYNQRQSGTAGVYNPGVEGQRTAYGETYANKQMTASHPVLPLGTLVRVQNLDNGRTASVRINDRGKECADCLITLSQAAANQLGLTYRGRVTVERTGFSNWNPAPAPTTAPASAPTYAQGSPYPNGQVAQPVVINRNPQWASRGGETASYGSQPATYGSAPAYGQQPRTATVPAGEYATLNAPAVPSVMSREVQPPSVDNQPATYSRYPAAQPRVYGQTNAQAYEPTPYGYQQPAAPAAPQQQPAPVVQQATPPAPTVIRYQQNRTVAAPTTYQTPAPRVYGSVAAPVAKGPETPPAAAAAPERGYVVQLAAYNNEMYAQNRVRQLQQMGLSNVFYRAAVKSDGQTINRVYAGTFATMAAAQQASKVIRSNYDIAGIVSSL